MVSRYRHVQLLAVLCLLLIVNPFVDRKVGFALIDVMLTVALLSAVVACSTRRLHLVAGVFLTLLMQGAALYRNFAEVEFVNIAYSALGTSFFAFITILILIDVLRDSVAVTLDTICGALAAYLLIGVGWAFAYALLDQLIPGSIGGLRAEAGSARYEDYLGFSFVTLTTLGYGNVVPANAKADALAAAEAVLGQVYLTVLVARLVALNLVNMSRAAEKSDESKQT